jgi:RNA polymerase sigma factor (TIGR02999 family)
VSTPPDQSVTHLLARIRDGDDTATGELLNAAYNDLRALAATLFRDENPGHTLQPTALVNEVCVRMLKAQPPASGWTDRNHFFRTAAKAMRNLLTDHARAKNAERRGGGARRITLDSLSPIDAVSAPSPAMPVDLIALDETVTKLSKFDERLGLVFELRFLAGLTVQQTATVADMTQRTVERDCQFIRAWLQRELGQ